MIHSEAGPLFQVIFQLGDATGTPDRQFAQITSKFTYFKLVILFSVINYTTHFPIH